MFPLFRCSPVPHVPMFPCSPVLLVLPVPLFPSVCLFLLFPSLPCSPCSPLHLVSPIPLFPLLPFSLHSPVPLVPLVPCSRCSSFTVLCSVLSVLFLWRGILRLCYPVSNTVRSVSLGTVLGLFCVCCVCIYEQSFNNFENNTTKVSVQKEQLTGL